MGVGKPTPFILKERSMKMSGKAKGAKVQWAGDRAMKANHTSKKGGSYKKSSYGMSSKKKMSY